MTILEKLPKLPWEVRKIYDGSWMVKVDLQHIGVEYNVSPDESRVLFMRVIDWHSQDVLVHARNLSFEEAWTMVDAELVKIVKFFSDVIAAGNK